MLELSLGTDLSTLVVMGRLMSLYGAPGGISSIIYLIVYMFLLENRSTLNCNYFHSISLAQFIMDSSVWRRVKDFQTILLPIQQNMKLYTPWQSVVETRVITPCVKGYMILVGFFYFCVCT